MGLFDSLRSRLFWLSGPPAAEPSPDSAEQPHDSAEQAAQPSVAAAPGAGPSADAPVVASDSPVRPEDQPASADAATASTADLSGRQERAAGRLLDDERLRGDLTDDEFQPLLDWAMAQAERLVDSTAGDSDEVAERRIDAGLSAVRDTVRAAGEVVSAYAEGDRERLTGALRDAGLLLRDARADGVISRLFVQRDLSGPEVAAQVAGQLSARSDDAQGQIAGSGGTA
jgi:hypothetical protein